MKERKKIQARVVFLLYLFIMAERWSHCDWVNRWNSLLARPIEREKPCSRAAHQRRTGHTLLGCSARLAHLGRDYGEACWCTIVRKKSYTTQWSNLTWASLNIFILRKKPRDSLYGLQCEAPIDTLGLPQFVASWHQNGDCMQSITSRIY